MAGRRVSTLPSIESSQQAHIDDLVQRNRTLDHTAKKLKEQVELEKTRAKTTIHDIQSKWHAEKKQWREAVDTLQACHRIAYLRVQVQVETERKNVLMEQAARRKDKLAKAHRDTMITRFQIRESELERVYEEEEGKAAERRARYEKEIKTLKGNVAELVARVHAQNELIEAGELAQDELQDQITELQKARAKKGLSSESIATRLERTILQLDNERDRNADLERSIDELKMNNEELKRQIDKSKSSETKDGTEMESLRKKRLELEVQVQALDAKLAKREGDDAKFSEMTKARLKNLEENRVLWQERAEELESTLEKLEADFKLATTELAKLKSAPKANGTTVASPHKVWSSLPSTVLNMLLTHLTTQKANTPTGDASEEEVQEAIAPVPSSPPTPGNSRTDTSSSNKPPRRRREQSKPVNDDYEVPFSTKGKGKGKETALASENRHPKTKGTRAKTKPRSDSQLQQESEKHSPTVAEDDSEIEELPPAIPDNEKVNRKEKVKKKRKPASDEEDVDLAAVRKPKRRKQNGDETTPNVNNKPRSKSKAPPSRAVDGSLAPAGVGDSASNLANTKPKKRRINLYSGGNDVPSFNFKATDTGGLNIPTTLSPVREEDAPTSTYSRPWELLRGGFSRKR
ncbi:hypothetical protein E1B28_011246 [Marasmius oreades]|uniref:Uncharacterized protein n=1 Tax=Marasmius oreades TaxID=181124 RepID=A0A9P7RV24_9AGAR|nr:uncharacterized protein E1B28_011246 [Marasmius oreades]KAG7089578.1 hypothetical protein E1B28_011246 [Marasmius oreades]